MTHINKSLNWWNEQLYVYIFIVDLIHPCIAPLSVYTEIIQLPVVTKVRPDMIQDGSEQRSDLIFLFLHVDIVHKLWECLYGKKMRCNKTSKKNYTVHNINSSKTVNGEVFLKKCHKALATEYNLTNYKVNLIWNANSPN